MSRIIEMISKSNILKLVALFVGISALQGCTTMTPVHDAPFAPVVQEQVPLEKYVDRHEYSVAKGDDVIGRLRLICIEKGDTLPDIAQHFSLGLNGVNATNPGVDTWVPEAGKRIILPMSFILPDALRKGIVINLATMRLFEFSGTDESLSVLTFPVGVGSDDRPSPMGQMRVERKTSRPTWYVPTSIAKAHLKKGDPLPASVPPGPQNPLGEFALYLSAPSYLIHGTNKPASVGLRATNGCMRLYADDIKKLYECTPLNTTVNIVNQPFLIGRSNGVVYLEVHGPTEDAGIAELHKVYTKLETIEKESGRTLDWSIVKKVLTESRGIPVPILETKPGSIAGIAPPQEVKHPIELNGKPKIPVLKTDAWTVLAADLLDEKDALRLAAIINHQGPPIPARVIAKDTKYRVIAGPFNDVNEAKKIIKRLKIDLELDGRLIEPVKK
jgi:L,D-transpeptidase ErfK/SrfK